MYSYVCVPYGVECVYHRVLSILASIYPKISKMYSVYYVFE